MGINLEHSRRFHAGFIAAAILLIGWILLHDLRLLITAPHDLAPSLHITLGTIFFLLFSVATLYVLLRPNACPKPMIGLGKAHPEAPAGRTFLYLCYCLTFAAGLPAALARLSLLAAGQTTPARETVHELQCLAWVLLLMYTAFVLLTILSLKFEHCGRHLRFALRAIIVAAIVVLPFSLVSTLLTNGTTPPRDAFPGPLTILTFSLAFYAEALLTFISIYTRAPLYPPPRTDLTRARLLLPEEVHPSA